MDASLLPALLPLPVTLAIAIVDARRQIISDRLNLLLLGLGLGLAVARAGEGAGTALVTALLQAALAYLLLRGLRAAYAGLRGRNGLGLGDVKFVAAATAVIGLAAVPSMLLVASAAALATLGIAALAGRPVRADTRLPFGPFLVVGLHVAALMAVA